MNRRTFNNLIDNAQFDRLFIEEMGWNNPQSPTMLPVISIDDVNYQPVAVAARSDFRILTCMVDSIPQMSVCRKLDLKIRNYSTEYLCIFVLNGTKHHLWMTPVRKIDKRDIVLTEYESSEKADVIFQKIDGISFGIDEQTLISDVRERINASFIVNSEKITKDFYAGFKKEHNAFTSFISGINDEIADKNNRDKQWYASVMLNRLMFCYFIQKKGFLDNNVHYLREKLEWSKQERGNNKFFKDFYLSFLKQLFHDGLNAPKHSDEFENMFGRVPYLNGGMFDEHQIERYYANLDIADEAFERLFEFFDKWNWHLDTRITASGKDINPDVLGYIFEQYINDRAQMGAYYTKEDITEYIGRNCILPYLFDAVAKATKESAKDFEPDGYVWDSLRKSGDRYIFDAVKKGYFPDWQDRIPRNIAEGIDTSLPNLLERRKDWNGKTADQFALPTEIWRETIERLQRCDDILGKITRGEITQINDFITYNLDIRSFAYNLLAGATDHKFVLHFYQALQKVTILDPTCGSGAFLFAALNILEPLYEVCIDRMQEFHDKNNNLFVAELDEISNKYRSNIQYFIYKSIILRNLYGVDIMAEATEIAKLRLFLKMVAVVEVDRRAPNLGLDPLPDIDFNIRCGNTLVGYATKEELTKDLAYGDMFANESYRQKIEDKMIEVATTYSLFKEVQFNQADDMAAFKQAKHALAERLTALNEILNHRMFAAASGITVGNDDAASKDLFLSEKYNKWLSSHQPFHWFAEFYQIIHDNGGFDVIIGNPPYVEYANVRSEYQIKNYKTESCGNLYAFVMERAKSIIRDVSYIGMIVPLSGHSTERMAPLVENFYKSFGLRLHLNLSADAHPQKLFEGVKFRLCIFFVSNAHKGAYSTKYTRWYAEERKYLFTTLVRYNIEKDYHYASIIGKIASPLWISIYNKVNKEKQFFKNEGTEFCLYNDAPINWMRSHSFIPYFCSERDGEIISRHLKKAYFRTKEQSECASALLNSTLFFMWWITHSSCYNVNSPELLSFRYTINGTELNDMVRLNRKLSDDMLANSRRRVYVYKSTGRVEYDEFYMKMSKPIIDEIDKVLAKHYGFTDEELDFIINYDIKYRMGDELNSEEE